MKNSRPSFRPSTLACLGAGALSLLATFGLAGCDTAAGQGAGFGAAGGAIIGGLTGSTRNAAIGAAAGAATGALIGAQVDRDRQPEAYARRRDYPLGTSGGPGVTVSPYSPFNAIETRGIPHGALVNDPSCNRIFVKP